MNVELNPVTARNILKTLEGIADPDPAIKLQLRRLRDAVTAYELAQERSKKSRARQYFYGDEK